MRDQDQQSRLFYELCALVLNIVRSPDSLIPFSSSSSTTTTTPTTVPNNNTSRRTQSLAPISPAGFASLLLGISLALMLCGSVTFMIGFILMPWVLGLVMVLYFFGILSSLSGLGRAIFGPVMSPPSPTTPPSTKEISGEGFRSSVLGIFPIMPF